MPSSESHRCSRIGVLLSAILFQCIAFYPSFAQPTLGLVELPDQYLLRAGHLSFYPRSGRLDHGMESDLRWFARASTANTSIVEEDYVVDAEQRSLEFGLREIINETVKLEIVLPLLWRGGGILDDPIDGWHEFFHLPRRKRDRIADGRHVIEGATDDGNAFLWDDEGVVLGNPRLSLQAALLKGEHSWISADLSISLPSQSSTQTHQGIDLLSGLLAGRETSYGSWHTGVAIGMIGDDDLYGVSYERYFVEGFIGIEVPYRDLFSFSIALWSGTGLVENVSGHPHSFGYLDLGVKIPVGTGTIELLVRENPWPQEGTPDVGLLLGYEAVIGSGS